MTFDELDSIFKSIGLITIAELVILLAFNSSARFLFLAWLSLENIGYRRSCVELEGIQLRELCRFVLKELGMKYFNASHSKKTIKSSTDWCWSMFFRDYEVAM